MKYNILAGSEYTTQKSKNRGPMSSFGPQNSVPGMREPKSW